MRVLAWFRRPPRRPAGSSAMPRAPGLARLPGDFLDELAFELDATERDARRQAERLALVSQLHRAASATARRLGRPVTVLDIIESACDERERERLTELVNRLRA